MELVNQNGKPQRPPPEDKRTPEQKRRDTIRKAHAAAFMADFDRVLQQRLQFVRAECAGRTGLPSRIVIGQSQVDVRVNRFVEYMLEQLATVQTFQGKTFGRLLDILEGRGMPDVGGADDGRNETQKESRTPERSDVETAVRADNAGGTTTQPGGPAIQTDA